MASPETPEPPLLTRAGMVEGARIILPLLAPVTIFGLAIGAAGAQRGLTVWELTAMNTFVFAGASQLVALGLWETHWTWASLFSIALVTFAVNARMILMGASLRPWLGPLPRWKAYALLLTLTDGNWIAAQRYREGGGRDIGVFLGSGLLLWVVWIVAPLPGYFAGKLVTDPRALALDLVMPVFFTAMVARLWRGAGDSWAWLTAGVTGILVQKLFGGSAHVVVGALAGMAVAGLLTSPASPPKGSASHGG